MFPSVEQKEKNLLIIRFFVPDQRVTNSSH